MVVIEITCQFYKSNCNILQLSYYILDSVLNITRMTKKKSDNDKYN